MAGPDKPQRGDEAELFENYHRQLLHRVRRAVCASPEVIEDACAFAWMEFLRFQPDRNRGWRSWLFVTAQREAWRLDRERCHALTIDQSDRDVAQPFIVGEPADTRDYYEQRLDFVAAMELLEELPPRPRQIAFLRAIGVPYADIMEITGLSQSHVSHLVARANERIRGALDAQRYAEHGLPPRAERLRELEKKPPPWLAAEIGPPPKSYGGRKSVATRLVIWRRAALAMDDYRKRTGFSEQDRGIGERPQDEAAERAFDLAQRAIDAFHASRRVSRELR